MSRSRELHVFTDNRGISFRTPYSGPKGPDAPALILRVNGADGDDVDYCLDGLDVEELYDLVKYVLEGRPIVDAPILCGYQWSTADPPRDLECCLEDGHSATTGHVDKSGLWHAEPDLPF